MTPEGQKIHTNLAEGLAKEGPRRSAQKAPLEHAQYLGSMILSHLSVTAEGDSYEHARAIYILLKRMRKEAPRLKSEQESSHD